MDNIQSYNEFINEGLIDNLELKIKNWWNNFQNKEEMLRKLHSFVEGANWVFLFLYLGLILTSFLPGTFGKSISDFIKNYSWSLAAIWLLWSSMARGDKKIKKYRKEEIKKKMGELRNMFLNNTYPKHYYAILGDRKNIKEATDKLIRDGVITDANVLPMSDVTIIDFSGTIKTDTGKTKEQDPYGEEEWGDEKFDATESNMMHEVSSNIESEYEVKFRPISKVDHFMDDYLLKSSNKTKERDRKWYDKQLTRLKDYREELKKPHREDEEEFAGMHHYYNEIANDLNYNSLHITNVNDRFHVGYRYNSGFEYDGEEYEVVFIDPIENDGYAYPTRLLTPENRQILNDKYRQLALEREQENRPRRNFMGNFGDFVVPGFEIKRPEVMER